MTGLLKMQINGLARLLASGRDVCVLTGAGISAESGLATFRGATADGSSLWSRYDPMQLATPEAFEADPALVSGWYEWRRQACLRAEPNAGHLALAELERWIEARGGTFTLITQNVDRLHARAGSARPLELHGDILRWRCTATGRLVELPAEEIKTFPIPSPFRPGALLRPNVVWFGEALPQDVLRPAFEAARTCDTFLAVGTSAVVQPAAGLVDLASEQGTPTVEVNLEKTPASDGVSLSIRARSAEVLTGVMAKLAELGSPDSP